MSSQPANGDDPNIHTLAERPLVCRCEAHSSRRSSRHEQRKTNKGGAVKIGKNLCAVAVLGLAMMAFAGVGTASASKLHATNYAASVNGSDSEFFGHRISLAGQVLQCNGSSLTGGLSEPTSTLGTYAADTTCNYWGEPALEMNGCGFTFGFGSDAGHFGRYSGTAEIGPPGCGPITLNSKNCKVTIKPQTGGVANYENIPGGVSEVSASVEIDDLEYTQSGAFCTNGTFANGVYTGTWKLSSPGAVGLFVEEDPHTPKFEAESYPATEVGTQDASSPQKMTMQGASVTCKEVTYSGSLSAASTAMTVTPSYSGCSAFGFLEATVNANGCSFVMNAGSALGGGKYQGTENISCPVGKSIEISAQTCKVSIPAQSGLSSASYETGSSSGQETVKASLNVSGLKYTATSGFLCPLTGGTFTNGKQSGGLTVQAKTGAGALQGIRIAG
jgi:hypothetical protein